MPVILTQNEVEESETPEELLSSNESEISEEYYDNLESQLENFCNLTDEEQFDFFSENSDIIDFNEEFVTICEIEDESEREYTLDDSIDGLISELRDDAEKNVEPTKIPSWVHDVFVWYAEESISENELLLEKLLSDDRFHQIQKSEQKIVPLVDWKYLLVLIVLTLTFEWFIRKYNGLI